MASGSLAAADVVIIIIYFILVICVGLWSSTKNRGSVGGYFLAGRSMHWMLVGASLFATNIASTHFIGLAGSGAESGIGVAIYEINAIYVLIALGWLFMPVYISSGIYTTPEYMRKRFGGQRIRIYLAVLSLIMYVLTKISADLYSGAIFIEQAVDWNMYVSVCVLLAIAALFTITGGLTAVIWTDFVQTIIMVIGSIWLMIEAFVSVYGFNNMRYMYERAVPNTTFLNPNETCGYPREDYFDLVRSAKTGDIPWPGIIGIVINSIWYWCSDQVIVQRSLAAKNLSYAKGGSVVAGFLKMLPLFIIVFPGMIARILFPDEIACTDPDICRAVCGSPSGCSNIAYPLLVLNLLPTGGKGLMMAVMLSAIMSSLTSIFNSSSTIFTIDIWRKMRKQASHVELMIVGRIAVLVLVVISILWLPVIQNSRESQLFIFVQEISSYFQPPVCAVYILSIFWPRLNEQGAFWSLMIGLVAGTVRMVLDFVYPSPGCGEEDTRPTIIQLHYLYFAILLFILTAISAVIISLITPPIDPKHLHRLTWDTRRSKEEREDIDTDSVVDVKQMTGDTGDMPSDTDSEHHGAVACAKRSGQWLCGIEQQKKGTPQDDVVTPVNTSIEETPRARRYTNIGAIVVMTCATFMFGFFS